MDDKRKLIRRPKMAVCLDDLWSGVTNLGDAIRKLEEHRDFYYWIPVENIMLEDAPYESVFGLNGYETLLVPYTPESDEEVRQRQLKEKRKREKRQKEKERLRSKKEAQERKELERLKEKYEND